MKLWVYIYKEKNTDLIICLTTSSDKVFLNRQRNMPIVYLRPFDIAFDALAHKHLLDSLSKESVLKWIDKHKEETKKWLNVLFGNNS